jgi:hypothetical protein
MKKRFAAILVSTFLLSALILVGYQSITRPRVLVLHSYDAKFIWVQGLDASIRKSLKGLQRPLLTHVHYMNLRGAPGRQFEETAAASAKRAIASFQPDVLVVFDDISARLVTPELLNRPDIKIVFAGIDETLEYHGFDKANNVAGVLERIPVSALKDAVTHLGKGRALTVACIGDARDVAVAEAAEIAAFDWKPHKLLSCEQVKSFPEWKSAIDRFNRVADVVFVSGYRGLSREVGSGSTVPPAEVGKWTEENSKALPMASKVTFVADGGAIAITPSPQEHGTLAARLTGRLLNGERADSIPVIMGKDFVVSVSTERLQRRGYDLPPVYEAAARAAGALY